MVNASENKTCTYSLPHPTSGLPKGLSGTGKPGRKAMNPARDRHAAEADLTLHHPSPEGQTNEGENRYAANV
jgi:hypothetical protein